MIRKTCCICGKTHVMLTNYNKHDEHTTCGPQCRRKRKTIRQKELRLEKRMKRLEQKHQAEASALAKVRGMTGSQFKRYLAQMASRSGIHKEAA